jgi:OPA family glycerol-3-phosphate transporter-like MFS transporter
MTAVQYAPGYQTRRFLNWFFMGLSYAFLYWGRYNLTVAKTSLGDLMSKADFGLIFGIGTVVYAFSFLINGPLTDRHGGRKMMLIAIIGSGAANFLMGLTLNGAMGGRHLLPMGWLTPSYCVLYAINMYFQSIGAVAIVHVNASWFHVSERGRFGGFFGAMISMGLFFAFDVSHRVLDLAGAESRWWIFYAPALALGAMLVTEFFLLRDRPSHAGFADFDTGIPKSEEPDGPVPFVQLFKSVFSNKILVTVALIGVCTGALRDGLMHWVPIYVAPTTKGGLALPPDHYINAHWGLQLMVAGIIGPMLGGWLRDKVFQSRCAPPAGIFYGVLILGVIALYFSLHTPYAIAAVCFFMALSYIGSQGLLTATAAMDFGGKAKATATGVIDGLVYVGTATQSMALGQLTSRDWSYWPMFLLPFAVVGFVLCLRIWRAKAGQTAAQPAAAKAAGAAGH